MSSTITSDVVLSVRGLNLVFRLSYNRKTTVRDLFIDFTSNPIETILRGKDSLHLLRNIDLELRQGDRLAILGVNGSGKTSLCRSIAGIFTPASGEITINGTCRAVFDANVGVMPELTGRENAHLLASLFFPEESEQGLDCIVNEATEFSELKKFLDVPYETYSLGMKARLFLSVVTAKSANLLILDEILDNTDRFFQKRMTERLMKFIQSAQAVIFVSHSHEHIKNTCNRAIVLHNSRIAYDGPVDKALVTYDFLNVALIERSPIHAEADE